MIQERKEYRKNFSSSGQLHMAGETLDFISHDVSVKGISIEVVPGRLLSEYADFEAYIKENTFAEIFVKDLMLTGEVEVTWLRDEQGKIMMGLEFHDVIYNADRLWLKRQFYRKEQLFAGFLMIKNKKIPFEGKNVSIDGLMICIKELDEDLSKNTVVKLYSDSLKIKALAKICWIREETEPKSYFLGLRYLSSD
ncbi:MAG: PilZ domain-containing protein [Gammaproteobacteria bacterium]